MSLTTTSSFDTYVDKIPHERKSQATHLLKKIPSIKKYIKSRRQTHYYINSLKYPPLLGMHVFTVFLVFDATLWKASLVPEMHCRTFCFMFSDLCWLFLYIFYFEHS